LRQSCCLQYGGELSSRTMVRVWMLERKYARRACTARFTSTPAVVIVLCISACFEEKQFEKRAEGVLKESYFFSRGAEPSCQKIEVKIYAQVRTGPLTSQRAEGGESDAQLRRVHGARGVPRGRRRRGSAAPSPSSATARREKRRRLHLMHPTHAPAAPPAAAGHARGDLRRVRQPRALGAMVRHQPVLASNGRLLLSPMRARQKSEIQTSKGR
jgi:hypothetical protein